MTDRHEGHRHHHLDEGTIHAWLDGALTPDESAGVEVRAQSCAECAALIAEARGLVAASSRILSSLDAVPAGVIPGMPAGVDQLAALRERRRATTRRWWYDRRIVAAASLVLVAGVSSLVLRSSTSEAVADRTGMTVESAPPATDQASAVADAPAVAPPDAAREAARDAKAVLPPPLPSVAPARARVATTPPTDSATSQKTTTAGDPATVGSALAANEARRAEKLMVDSTRELTRVEQSARAEQQLRQQGVAAAPPTFQQLRVDSARRPSMPPAPTAGSLRLAPVVTTGIGAAMADAVSSAGNCYRLRVELPSLSRMARDGADTVKLLSEQAPALSDPSWFRTQMFGAARDSALAWRSIDAVTVELRARFGADSVGVRFMTNGALPDVRSAPGVLATIATKIACPN